MSDVWGYTYMSPSGKELSVFERWEKNLNKYFALKIFFPGGKTHTMHIHAHRPHTHACVHTGTCVRTCKHTCADTHAMSILAYVFVLWAITRGKAVCWCLHIQHSKRYYCLTNQHVSNSYKTKVFFLIERARIQINIAFPAQYIHIHFTKELVSNVSTKGDNWMWTELLLKVT